MAGRPGKVVLAAAGLCLGLAGGASAQLYLAGDLAAAWTPKLGLDSGDTDRASRCDEFINPRYAELDGCTNPDRGDGAVDDWSSEFSAAWSGLAGAAIGYRFRERWRVELEAFHRTADLDESSPILDPAAGDVPFTHSVGAEVLRADETVGRVTASGVFANLYFDIPNESRFTPFVGVGVGIARASMDYGAWWERSHDPALIDSAQGFPNEAELRRNLAGSVSRTRDRLRDRLSGWQVMVGTRHQLNESLALELRLRWVELGTLHDGGDYITLRSHASNLRRDGSEPVRYFVATDDTQSLSVGLRVSYTLGARR